MFDLDLHYDLKTKPFVIKHKSDKTVFEFGLGLGFIWVIYSLNTMT